MEPGISVHFMVKDPPLDRFAALVAYLRPLVNEFVIVDTGSSDADKAVMASWTGPEKVPVTILEETFENFSATRNKGLATHKHEWTLGLDPDELPSLAMMEHVRWACSPDGMKHNPRARGWVFWTYNWWSGVLGQEMPYHWHTRLWKTEGSFLYRPIHELVNVQGEEELKIRGSDKLPLAPKNAYLIHSKGPEDIAKADELYGRMGEISR